MKKGGQMKMSFGMIFSIILIIVFVAFATYAIIKFIDMQQGIQVDIFKNDLQDDLDAMWESPQGSRTVAYSLPDKIDAVCFTRDDDYENLYFESDDFFEGVNIEHIDIDAITTSGDFCIENVEGEVSITLVKDYGEILVKIE